MHDATPIRLPLPCGRTFLIDAADYEWVSRYRWHSSGRRRNYVATRVPGTGERIKLHRLLLGAPAGREGDHIDGDGLNNTRANLRIATSSENNANRKRGRRSFSGFRGVYFIQQDYPLARPWRAQISIGNKSRFLGYFGSAEAAAAAYDAAARKAFGQFAQMNFPQNLQFQQGQIEQQIAADHAADRQAVS